MGIFKLPRITTANRVGLVLGEGELVYDTDLDTVWRGDGVTAGGLLDSGGGTGTDLGYTAATRLLTSSTGADVTLPIASAVAPGLAPTRSGVATEYLDGTGVYSVPPSGGGGVTDGDKGDVTVTASGATWTIDAGVVTLAKQAALAANSIIGNNTGGAATPIALTAAQAKTLLAIASGDVSGLAAIATSGSASDLGAGTLPAARFDDTAHGARAGGTLHADVVAAGASGFMTDRKSVV